MMPVIDLAALRGRLDPEDYALVARLVEIRGPNRGRLVAQAPDLRHQPVVAAGGALAWKVDQSDAQARYIWRVLVYLTSDKPEHQTWPDARDHWLEGGLEERRATMDRLESVIDVVVREALLVERADGSTRHFARRE